MTSQSAPFISQQHKDLLQGCGYASTWDLAAAMPVDVWRSVQQRLMSIHQQQTNSAVSAGGAAEAASAIFTLKNAAEIIQQCKNERRRFFLATRPAASACLSFGHNKGDDHDGDGDNCDVSPTPVASLALSAATPAATVQGKKASLNTTATAESAGFAIKTMAQLLQEEEEGCVAASDDDPTTTSTSPSSSSSSPSLNVRKQQRIVTFSESIDALCGGGGIECGCVTELIGSPGMGKTQLSMQLAVAVQLPANFGGLDAECLYIDTEGSFVPSRFREIAVGAATQVQKIIQLQQRTTTASSSSSSSSIVFTPETIMRRVHYLRVVRLSDLLAIIEALPEVIETLQNNNSNNADDGSQQNNKRPVKLVIIDSIAFHFRHALANDTQLRAKTLFHVGTKLQEQAMRLGAAVLVTNQLTTTTTNSSSAAGGNNGGGANVGGNQQQNATMMARSYGGGNDPSTTGGGTQQQQQLVPALGDAWAHCPTYRLWIQQPSPQLVSHLVATSAAAEGGGGGGGQGQQQQSRHQMVSAILHDQSVRAMLVLKSPTSGRSSSLFRITSKGIRNVNI